MILQTDNSNAPEFLEELSHIASNEEPASALKKIAEKIKTYLDSCGAKISVIERTHKGPGLHLLTRTDTDMDEDDNGSNVLLCENKGLIDWVVQNNQWLLVPTLKGQEIHSENSLMTEAITQQGDTITLEARSEKEFDPSFEDDEETMLLVPIETNGHSAGALTVWRYHETSYTKADAEKLVAVVHHITAACTRLIQLTGLKKELEQVSFFADALHDIISLKEAYTAFAQGIGRLTEANHVALLYHDPGRDGHLYHCGVWNTESESNRLKTAFQGFSYQADFNKEHWEDDLIKDLTAYMHGHHLANYSCRNPLLFFSDSEDLPPRVIAVIIDLQQENNQRNNFFTNDEFLYHRASSFMHYAVTLLRHHINSYDQKISAYMDNESEDMNVEPTIVLEQAATFLKEALNASAVIIYTKPFKEITPIFSTPTVSGLESFTVKQGSLSSQVFESRQPCYIPDMYDDNDEDLKKIDHEILNKLKEAFQWHGLKSLILYPFIIDQRCVAMISLVTDESNSYLNRHHKDICASSVKQAGLEYQKAIRPFMLAELNNLASKFSSIHTEQDKKEIVEDLQQWMQQFVKPECEIAVIARNLPDNILIKSCSRGIKQQELEIMAELSKTWKKIENQLPGDKSHRHTDSRKISLPGIAIPIMLKKAENLQGHLFVLHKTDFTQQEKNAIRECAREISLIVHSEQLIDQWKNAMGRYRHSVIGPVQGLKSAAEAIALSVNADNADVNFIEKCRRKIKEETENIRLWRENQRLYQSDIIDIRPRIASLRPLFIRCVERYKPLFESRGIKVNENWMPRGELRFSFDEQALDLAFSNLLDNAGKYAFFHREITIGAASHGYKISLWVEDIGHQIPDRIEDMIYKTHHRIDWKDPVRSIEGEGLGLPMALKIVQAHGGKLQHSCEPAAKITEGDHAPFKVRFTITLPTNWKPSR